MKGGVVAKLGRAALTLLLALTSVGLSVLCVEVGLRLAGHEAIYEIYSKPSLFWRYDALLGWSHEPEARGEFVGPRPWPIEFHANVSINSLGLRGPEVPPREGGPELRVLFAGDSVVAAFEVENELTFVSRVEGLLRDRLGVAVRTINAGVRGYGTDQTYLYFRDRGWKLEPDLVVFLHSGNDPSDNTTLHEMRRPFGKPAFSLTPIGELALVGSPVPRYPMCSEVLLSPEQGVQRVDATLGRVVCTAQMLLFDRSALFSYLTLSIPWEAAFLKRIYNIGNPHPAQQLRGGSAGHDDFEVRLATRIVIAFAEEARRRGADFLLVGEPSQLGQLDLTAVARAGIPVIRYPEFDSPDLHWRRDGHFNPDGHRRLAEFLAPEIASQLRARMASNRPGS